MCGWIAEYSGNPRSFHGTAENVYELRTRIITEVSISWAEFAK